MQCNPTPIRVMAQGLAKLVEGQKRFGEEFGLSADRVFPCMEETLLNGNDLFEQILGWMQSESDGSVGRLERLFHALLQHQLALLAALDGIALQTLNEFRHGLLVKLSAASRMNEFQRSQQLRYQRLVAPGFINTYSQVREALGGNREKSL